MSYLDNLFSLKHRTAIVTGAARGNGRGLAGALGRAGANLLLVDKEKETLERTLADFTHEGITVDGIVIDITEGNAASAIVQQAIKKYGTVDILVNNAGITLPHDALTYPKDAWEKTYAVNLEAAFHLCCAAGMFMKEHGGGSIINITSLGAELAFPDNPAYTSCKAALKQMSKSLALDLAPYNIRVNCIGPGYFKTDMTKGSYNDPQKQQARAGRTMLGRWGDPEKDFAGAVIYLASEASSYVTGQDIYIDGGWLSKGL